MVIYYTTPTPLAMTPPPTYLQVGLLINAQPLVFSPQAIQTLQGASGDFINSVVAVSVVLDFTTPNTRVALEIFGFGGPVGSQVEISQITNPIFTITQIGP